MISFCCTCEQDRARRSGECDREGSSRVVPPGGNAGSLDYNIAESAVLDGRQWAAFNLAYLCTRPRGPTYVLVFYHSAAALLHSLHSAGVCLFCYCGIILFSMHHYDIQ